MHTCELFQATSKVPPKLTNLPMDVPAFFPKLGDKCLSKFSTLPQSVTRRSKLYEDFPQLYVEGFVQYVNYDLSTMLIKFPALLEIHELRIPFSYSRVKGVLFLNFPSNPKLLTLEMYLEKEPRSAIPKIKFDFDRRAQYACSGVTVLEEVPAAGKKKFTSPAAQEKSLLKSVTRHVTSPTADESLV